MKNGRLIVNSYVSMSFEFSGIRMLDETMIPNKWNIKFDVIPLIDVYGEPDYAFERIYFWLETQLEGAIFVNFENEIAVDISDCVYNNPVYCPGEPADSLIVKLIHHKLSSLIPKDKYMLDSLSISSSDTNTSFTFTPNDIGYDLPTTVKEYTDCASLYKEPWWMRPDGFTFEFLKGPSDKGKITELYDDVEDPLKIFDEEMASLNDDDDKTLPKNPGKIIKVKEWEPKEV